MRQNKLISNYWQTSFLVLLPFKISAFAFYNLGALGWNFENFSPKTQKWYSIFYIIRIGLSPDIFVRLLSNLQTLKVWQKKKYQKLTKWWCFRICLFYFGLHCNCRNSVWPSPYSTLPRSIVTELEKFQILAHKMNIFLMCNKAAKLHNMPSAFKNLKGNHIYLKYLEGKRRV